ncbi:MAG: hypothetical protein ACRENZ_05850 [Thermodesulfobacteriota bacterium]
MKWKFVILIVRELNGKISNTFSWHDICLFNLSDRRPILYFGGVGGVV